MSGFVFQWAEVLPLLLLGVPLWYLLRYARNRRAELIQAMGGGMSTHRRLRDTLRVLAFLLLIMALARPGYAPEKMSTSRMGRDVVFALDVSQSMLAEDVSPSRLEMAKQAVRDALKMFTNERVSLVVYAGSATIMCPLTYDYDFVRYMLEQVHTRSVDFGGTTLQSAVEKVVDQVLMEDRAGVQDLIVITDGGDHGSLMPKVAELLELHGVDLLLLGIGNPREGAPIPIVNEDGVSSMLRAEDAMIYTTLEDATLRSLAAQSRSAEYVPVADQAFDLGQIYGDYVVGREQSASVEGDGIVVYQEGALFFVIPALLLLLLSECWGANGLRFRHISCLLIMLGTMPEGEAAESHLLAQFKEASELYKDGSIVEAEAIFSELALTGDRSGMSANNLAVVELNRGLCLMALSRAESESSALIGLDYAQQAQLAFLAAKRYAPEMHRSGMRLESAARWLAALQSQIDAAAEEQDELQQQMQQLYELLRVLHDTQQTLRLKVADKNFNRRRPKRAKDAPPRPPVEAPPDANVIGKTFALEEQALGAEAVRIYAGMQELEKRMSLPAVEGVPPMESVLAEPLKLMAKVPSVMDSARGLLLSWNTWPAAEAEQLVAEHLIEDILRLLGNNSSNESEGEDYDAFDEEGEYDYSDEMDESMMSSMQIEGDFAAGGAMQALPVPNYSVEDILRAEQGSLQFRQQQRVKANVGKVEKDY